MIGRYQKGFLATLLVLTCGIGWYAYSQSSQLYVGEITQVSAVRFSRTHFDYQYRIQIINQGPARRNVSAFVRSNSAVTTILDNEVEIGNVPAGATIQSGDTFTLRHDRSFPFKPAALIWTIESEAANTPPVANAGVDQTVTVGVDVTLNGSGSSDVDGNALTYRWSLVSRPAGSTAALSPLNAVMPVFTTDRAGSYEFALVVNDGQVDSATDTIRVSTLNSSPIARAGDDRTVARGALVALDGSASSDPDGDALQYEWTLVSRPPGSQAVLTAVQSANASMLLDRPGNYTARLVVNDGVLNSSPDEITVSTENSVPMADAGSDRSAFVGAAVVLDGSASSDADGDALSYAWTFSSRPDGSVAALSGAATPAPSYVADVAGLYVIQLIVNDGFANSTPDTATVTIDVRLPPSDSDGDGLTDAQELQLGTDPNNPDSDGDTLLDGREVNVTNTDPLDADSDDDTLTDGAEIDIYQTNPNSMDTDGDSFRDDEEVRGNSDPRASQSTPAGQLPPDPASVAAPLKAAGLTPFVEAVSFLYSEPNGVQRQVAPGAIDTLRASVLRGRVIRPDGAALPGVTIAVSGNSQYGHTLTRSDGRFDLVVNGGPTLVLNFVRQGYLTAHRAETVDPRDYSTLRDVVMVPIDSRSTIVNLGSLTEPAVHSATRVTDADGSRASALMFNPGTTAVLVLPNGSTQPITSLTVRATEYTVGAAGPKSMPAKLPNNSGYTYAVELSADEAIAAGAVEVRFSQPVINYVENFLGFPVGLPVPTGYYDRLLGCWVPAPNGKIIELLAVAGGMAVLDTNGDRIGDSVAALTALGISDAERRQLALLYAPGTSFWRVPVNHFTPWDHNFPFAPPGDAKPPGTEPNGSPDDPLGEPFSPEDQEDVADSQEICGSVVECENQVLRESIPVSGTPWNLNYSSERARGRSRSGVEIPLTNASPPASLRAVQVEIQVAGRVFEWEFSAAPNQSFQFAWDGIDAYGRQVSQTQLARVKVGYVYNGVYQAPANFGSSFAQFSGVPLAALRLRQQVVLSRETKVSIRSALTPEPGISAIGLGGWTLDPVHFMDFSSGTLHLGNGTRRKASALGADARRVVGTGTSGSSGVDGTPGISTPIRVGGLFSYIALSPDGELYFTENGFHRIRKLTRDGLVRVVAGTGVAGFSGEGVEARLSQVSGPVSISVAPDGTVQFIEQLGAQRRVRRIDAQGRMSTASAVLGTFISNNVLMAEDNCCATYLDVQQLFRRSADGIANPLTGPFAIGVSNVNFDAPATSTQLGNIETIAVETAPNGDIYIGASPSITNRSFPNAGAWVGRIGADGILRRVAGQRIGHGFSGDGGPATAALLSGVGDLKFDEDGNLYIADTFNRRVRRVDTQGIITTVAGSGRDLGFGVRASLDGTTALNTDLGWVFSIAVHPTSRVIYVTDATPINANQHAGENRILRFGQPLPGTPAGETLIPAADAREGYFFDQFGRHIRTVDLRTNATLLTMTYDPNGLLVGVNGSDKGLTIARDATGTPITLATPNGVATSLTINSDGLLQGVSGPLGESVVLGYAGSTGLLTRFQNPRGNVSSAEYDEFGRLISHPQAQGGVELAKTGSFPSSIVRMTTAENRVTTYATEVRQDGSIRQQIDNPGGVALVIENVPGKSEVRRYQNGTVVSTTSGVDPRFGAMSPISTEETTAVPSGLSRRVVRSRLTTLSAPINPLSITQQVDTTSTNGRTSTSTYIAATRETVSRTPLGRTRTQVLNASGRLLQTRIPGRASINYDYDLRGRLSSIAQGARLTRFEYDARGNVASITDPLNRVVQFARDSRGQITALTGPNNQTAQFGFDANGNVTSISPPGRPAHEFTYSPLDLLESYRTPEIFGEQRTSRNEYDLDRGLQLKSLADGRQIDPAYDAAGRLSTLAIGRGEYRYVYHATTGRLGSIEAPGGSVITNAFDGSLLVGQTLSGPVSGSVSRAFNSDFKVTSVAINGANAIMHGYDNDGLLTQVGGLTLTRDGLNGSLRGSSLGSVSDEYGYDDFSDVTAYVVRFGTTVLFQQSHVRDLLGRITRTVETESGVTLSFDYTYDLAGRLLTVRRNDVTTSSYSHDSNGNRLSHTSPAGVTSATYDARDRLITYGASMYSYSADGQLRGKLQGGQATAYQYDELDNLLRVDLPNGNTVEYLIDGLNRRIGRRVNGLLQAGWLYNGTSPVAELDAAGSVVSTFMYGKRRDVPDFMVRAGQTFRIISDHLGSVRLVVNVSTGAVVQRIQYDEYGLVISDSNPGFQPFGFAGGLWDPTVGLLRLGKRDYLPVEGRFTSKDPTLFAGGQLNLYAYAHNNPVNYIDSEGKAPGRPDSTQQPQGPCQGFWCDAARFLVGGLTGGGNFEREFGDPPGAELSNIIGCALAQYATGALICAERGNLAGVPEPGVEPADSPPSSPACNPLYQSCPQPTAPTASGGMCPLPGSQTSGPAMPLM